MTEYFDVPPGIPTSNRGGSRKLGCGLALSIPLLFSLLFGPIDCARGLYNAYKDPHFNEKLLDYSRRDIRRGNPGWTEEQVDMMLKEEIRRDLYWGGDYFELKKATPRMLFDAAERHASSWYQRWIWADLDAE